MTGPEIGKVSREMAEAVKSRVPDPAGWMLALRRISERLGLDPAMSIRLGDVVLIDVCHGLVRYAASNSLESDQIRAVL